MQLEKQAKPELVALITASDYKDSKITRHYGNLTMKTAMNSGMPSVTKWIKVEGEEKMISGLAKLFIGTSLYFDKVLNQAQADAIAVKIIGSYEMSNLKLEDLVVCCKEITENDQYGRLTPAKIISHIKAYVKRREQAAIADSLDSVQQSKLYGTNLHERVHRAVKESAKDKTKAIDRTRADARKFYK